MRVLVISMAPFTAAEKLGGFPGLIRWSLRQTEARQSQFKFPFVDQLQWKEIKPCLVANDYNAARALFPTREEMIQQEVGAIVMSGSSYMVTDLLPWSEAAADWIRTELVGNTNNNKNSSQTAAPAVPVLAVCYSHQLIAHALGGTVEYSKFGKQIGVKKVCWNFDCEELKNDPVFSSLAKSCCSSSSANSNASTTSSTSTDSNNCFSVLSIHHQTVSKLPEGAKVFAFSEKEPHQIVKFRDNIYSTQFHGEYNSKYCEFRFDKQFSQEMDIEDEYNAKGKNDTSLSSAIFARFFDYAWKLHERNKLIMRSNNNNNTNNVSKM